LSKAIPVAKANSPGTAPLTIVAVFKAAPLKAAAAKAGFKPNYACEEGKCGSCELICNGKTKIRPCIGKVPGSATTLTNP